LRRYFRRTNSKHVTHQINLLDKNSCVKAAAELVPADDLWGKSVWETDHLLHAAHQDPLLRIAAVGRAAEKGCLFAAVVNDLHRAAGRSGVGTVMASKNLKAVAIRGTRGVGNIKDPKTFMQAVTAAKKILAEHPVTSQGLPKYGTQVLINVINEVGAMPTRNMQEVQFEGAGRISGEAMHKPRPSDGRANLVTNAACFGCTIACGRISRIDQGHYTVVKLHSVITYPRSSFSITSGKLAMPYR
jgi:aldehyde:ferredoxin oxidoreductase